jgi:16S rRNA (guanine1516-N2)-methyltransferase
MAMPDHASQQTKVVIIIEDEGSMFANEQAQQLSAKTGFPIVKPLKTLGAKGKKHKHLTPSDKVAPWQLAYTEKGLALRMTHEPSWGDIIVDFDSAGLLYRKDKGGGKNEAIAKAIGIKTNPNPSVIDCTAGMGNDSFVMASVGAQVTMLERSKVIAALLDNALKVASEDNDVILNMNLVNQDAHDYLVQQKDRCADVIYLDPMFPHKKKSALVKKEMRAFQLLLGADQDSEQLLTTALSKASARVVVKRPSYAEPIANQQNRMPSMAIESKKHRFDVYIQH